MFIIITSDIGKNEYRTTTQMNTAQQTKLLPNHQLFQRGAKIIEIKYFA